MVQWSPKAPTNGVAEAMPENETANEMLGELRSRKDALGEETT